METSKNPADSDSLSCEVCMKVMSTADEITPEATDYYLHFCGLDCYAQWKKIKGLQGEQKPDANA